MHEEDNRREEKIEARDIRLGRNTPRVERPHGKVYRWLDNFWYHHKWKTIIISFFAVVVLVCTLQMCTKEDEGDIAILMAGPYGFATEESGIGDLQAFLDKTLPQDYDENGAKRVDIVQYTVYSEEQIKERQAQDIYVNTANNSNNYQQYVSYLQTGYSSLLFLDPWLAEELKNGQLLDISSVLGYVPEGALSRTEADGRTVVYGIRLGDTALYRDNVAMQALPEDTVICIAAPLYGGKTEIKETRMERAKAYLTALMKDEQAQ